MSDTDTDTAERERAIAVLEAAYEFPVDYDISIIGASAVLDLVVLRQAVEADLASPLGPDAYSCVPSREGKYASHRFRVPCRDAPAVLALFKRVRAVPGVITAM